MPRSSIRSGVIKRQFGYNKARYHGLAKSAAHVLTLFELSAFIVVGRVIAPGGEARPITPEKAGKAVQSKLLSRSDAENSSIGARCSDLPWQPGPNEGAMPTSRSPDWLVQQCCERRMDQMTASNIDKAD